MFQRMHKRRDRDNKDGAQARTPDRGEFTLPYRIFDVGTIVSMI